MASDNMSIENNNENLAASWVPLLDYAVMNGLSTSTLRRYIKANKVQFKVERGRYLLRSESQKPQSWDQGATQNSISLYQRIRELEEQVGELKMLVAIYEEKLGQTTAHRG